MPDMLLYLTLGLALVLALRAPLRRLSGPGPAFTLWLLPPWLAALPWLPALPPTWSIAPALLVFPAAPSVVTQAAADASTLHWLPSVWLGGTLICLLRLTMHYRRLLQQSRTLPDAMRCQLKAELDGLDPRRLRLHPAGPAVLWAPRSLLLLPVDFLERFDADQRRLILRHERTHLRRGDAAWSLLAELAVALLWFHPLAWLALPRFRLDQELACDERVLRELPQDEAKYAHTLLHSAGTDAQSVLIPWFAEPQLKERLNMIRHDRRGTWMRRIGFAGLAALMAGGTLVVQAAVHTKAIESASSDLSYNARILPHYPEDAIKNRQEGMVILTILVGTDGTPLKVDVDPATHEAPSLVKAASDAAMQWHFNPGMKNGKPVEGYVRVPVQFNLDPLPPPPPSIISPNS